MTKHVSPAILGLVVFSSCLAARAEPATPEGAAQIAQTLSKYVGALANGDHPAIVVSPKGDAYEATFDTGSATQWLKALGIDLSITPAKLAFSLARRQDGNWLVAGAQDIAGQSKSRDTTQSFKALGSRGEWVFNPSLRAVVSSNVNIASFTNDVSTRPPGGGAVESSFEWAPMRSEGSASAAGPGAVTMAVSATYGGMKQRVFMSKPTGGSATPPLDVRVGLGETRADLKIEAARNDALLDLWAWLVAHPSFDAIRASQGELKPLLRAAIPLFDRFGAVVDAKKLSISAMEGKSLSADGARFELDLSGVTPRGSLREAISLTGLDIADGLLPPWAFALRPRDVAIDVAVSGYDPAGFANAFIDAFDLDAVQPLNPRDRGNVFGRLLPSGMLDLSVNKLRVAGPGYELVVEGSGRASVGGRPVGTLKVQLKGFDALQASLTEGAKTDATASQALAMLGVAKLMSRPGADGAMGWDLGLGPNGEATINGVQFGGKK